MPRSRRTKAEPKLTREGFAWIFSLIMRDPQEEYYVEFLREKLTALHGGTLPVHASSELARAVELAKALHACGGRLEAATTFGTPAMEAAA